MLKVMDEIQVTLSHKDQSYENTFSIIKWKAENRKRFQKICKKRVLKIDNNWRLAGLVLVHKIIIWASQRCSKSDKTIYSYFPILPSKDLKKISFLHLNLKLFLYIIIGANYCLNMFHMKGIRFEYIYIYIYIWDKFKLHMV